MNAWGVWVLAAASLFALVVIVSGVLDLFTTTTAERRGRRDETAQYRAMRRALRTDRASVYRSRGGRISDDGRYGTRRRRWYVDVEEEA